MKIFLIRHGDPDYKNDTLTEKGHREAAALVAYLRDQGITSIYSSPLGRARDTARYTAEALGLEVVEQAWMAELDLRTQSDNKECVWDVPGHSIRNRDYLADTRNLGNIPDLPVRRIEETLGEIRSCSDEFLRSLGYHRKDGCYEVAGSSDRQIAVFAHGGFGLAWLSVLLEIPAPLMWSGFFLHTSSVTQILFDERSNAMATPRCIMLSALPHLFAASQEPSRAGVRANYT